MLAFGGPCPQARMAAGAPSSTGVGAPPPARTHADARLQSSMPSGPHAPALILPLALGPHPQRELTLMLAFGGPCPQARMAAGATSSTGAGAPPPARTHA